MNHFDINERFRQIILYNTPEYGRFAGLEAITGIPATSWNKTFHGKQKPSAEMIQAVARQWPEHAFWLATGITDAKSGHISCHGGLRGSSYPERTCSPRHTPKLYFAHLVAMSRHMFGGMDPYLSEVDEREAETNLARLDLSRECEDNAFRSVEAAKLLVREAESAEQAAKECEAEGLTTNGGRL